MCVGYVLGALAIFNQLLQINLVVSKLNKDKTPLTPPLLSYVNVEYYARITFQTSIPQLRHKLLIESTSN